MKWFEKVIKMPAFKKAQFFILGIIAYDALLYKDLWIIGLVGFMGVILWNCNEYSTCSEKRFCFLDGQDESTDRS